ncbi:SET domain-containing protein [Streptomyces sp. NPDC060194]|uniref:SET domain-containing protein n=1 Tax=Streptomyces sp. NPDC060194 TaxID=3347069 RepID=UPI003665243A
MTDQLPPPVCWLHPDVESRVSGVAGVGLFARVGLPVGTVVSRLGGKLVAWSELQELFAAAAGLPEGVRRYVDTVAISRTRHLVLPPGSTNGFGNHSCDPNLWWTDPYSLTVRRDVAAGAELTFDYATCTGDEAYRLDCECRSPLCRGAVTGADWRLPELRARYGEHWVPVLRERWWAGGINGVNGPEC